MPRADSAAIYARLERPCILPGTQHRWANSDS